MILIHLALWTALLCAYVTLRGGLTGVARKRNYKSGSRWALFRWTDVDSEYILRLHVFKTPWCAVCLHWIRKPDAEPWLHDHPVSFLSVILRGKYAETRRRPDGSLYHKVNRWFNFVRANRSDRHRIVFCRSNTLALCFMGPKTQEWGFYVWEEVEPGGWLFWKDYYARLKAGEPLRSVPYATMEMAAHACEDRYMRYHAALKAGAYAHEDKRLVDTHPADDFDSEEATWPADHK